MAYVPAGIAEHIKNFTPLLYSPMQAFMYHFPQPTSREIHVDSSRMYSFHPLKDFWDSCIFLKVFKCSPWSLNLKIGGLSCKIARIGNPWKKMHPTVMIKSVVDMFLHLLVILNKQYATGMSI